MKVKHFLFLIAISFLWSKSYSQMIIDNFENRSSSWVSGTTKIILSKSNGCMKVEASKVGASYEGFGNYFRSHINMTRHTVVKMKIMVPKDSAVPTIRVDLCDNNGYYTNASEIKFKPVADGAFHEYTFNYKGKFNSSYPSTQVVNAAMIVRAYIYLNPGGPNYSGTIYVDDLIVDGAQDPDLILDNASWKYLDNGNTPPSYWKTANFDDSQWTEDSASLGYGNGDKTTIRFGNDALNKHITSYFRNVFTVVDTQTFKNLILNIMVDDGAIVYLNGNEIARINMPEGTIDATTLARTDKSSESQEKSYHRFVLPESLLVMGENVLAAEVHQASATSDDLSFGLNLLATEKKTGMIRCPYLQSGGEASMVIRWKTLEATPSVVKYGKTMSNLKMVVDSQTQTDEHIVKLSNLLPGTKYYYSVGTGKTVFAGGDSTHYFITAPSKGTEIPINIWAVGDAGYAIGDQRKMRDSYYRYIGKKHTDVWLMLGDNAYSDGTEDEHQLGIFENMFETMLSKTVAWTTPGNHDIRKHRDHPLETAPYYKIFTMPQEGESGGVASHSPAYYSFDYGNLHVVSIESNETPRYDTAAMATWLKADLAANTSKWTIAFLHHPPYSKGSHNSDDTTGEDKRCTEIRTYIVPILEKGRVDLVLSGHSHSYERSYLVNGHYGFSDNLLKETWFVNDTLSGRPDEHEEYQKDPKNDTLKDRGTIYNQVGCSGFKEVTSKLYWTKQPDNLITKKFMYISTNSYIGSMAIEINKDSLNAKFIDFNGIIRDNYKIIKCDRPYFVAQKNIKACESFTIKDKKITTTGVYNDTNKTLNGVFIVNLEIKPTYFETASASVAPGRNYIFGDTGISTAGNYIRTLTSVDGCDSTVNLTLKVTTADIDMSNDDKSFTIQPNPTSGQLHISYSLLETTRVEIELYNSMGARVETILDATQTAGQHEITHFIKGYENSIMMLVTKANGKIISTETITKLKQ